MKVLHLLKSNAYSGAENVVITMIKNMPPEIQAVYVCPDGKIRNTLIKKNVCHHLLKNFSIAEIRDAIENIKPDIIHAHDFTASVLATLIAKKETPIISHIHNNPPWIRFFNWRTVCYYMTTFRLNRIFVVSNAVKNEYFFHNLIDSKIKVLGNPIDLSDLQKELQLIDPMIQKDFDLIFIGRLTEQKDPLRFVRLVKRLCDIKKISAIMLGEGELLEDIKNEIKRLHLEEYILLKGFQSRPSQYLRNSYVLCMPSRFEGFGMVAVEAISLGIPVVAAKVGGLPEIINSSCGKLCVTDQDYIEEILKLLTDQDYYEKKSQAALIQARSLGNINCLIQEVVGEYKNIVENAHVK